MPSDTTHPELSAAILVVSSQEEDHFYLRSVFRHSGRQIQHARSWAEAAPLLAQYRIGVMICDGNLPDATWQDALAVLSQVYEAPLLIVASRLADERFWAEVLNCGGYDVLTKPFDATEVFRTVSLALMSWTSSHRSHCDASAAATNAALESTAGVL